VNILYIICYFQYIFNLSFLPTVIKFVINTMLRSINIKM